MAPSPSGGPASSGTDPSAAARTGGPASSGARTAALLLGGAIVLAALVAVRARMGIDYLVDAAPSLRALVDGDLGAFTAQQPAMGPLSIVLRAPFVWLAQELGWSDLGEYRLGAFACLVPVALVALLLARTLLPAAPAHVAVVFVALLTVNPIVFNALQAGHPEEPLAGALAVAAVVVAGRGHALAAIVLLAAAVATKQSALVAVGPVLFALMPVARRRAALVGLAAVVVLLAPFALAGAGEWWRMNTHLLEGSVATLPFSPWWLVASGPAPVRFVPDWAAPLGRALTLVLPLAVGWWLARRAGGRLTLRDALGLLVLGTLARCLLDPADNPYYHLPALFALAAWEVVRRPDRVPWLATAATAVLWALVVLPWRSGSAWTVAIVYLATAIPLLVWVARTVVRDGRPVS